MYKINTKNLLFIISIYFANTPANAELAPREQSAAKAIAISKQNCESLMEKGKGNTSLTNLSRFQESAGKIATMSNIRTTSLDVCISASLERTLAYFSNDQAAKDRADYHEIMFGFRKAATLSEMRSSLRKINKALSYDVADAAFDQFLHKNILSENKEASAPEPNLTQ